GTDDNDPYYATTVINAEGVQGTPATHLPVDAIQEFNAEENPPAEYGWKPGAVINVGLKSGTNDFHGSTYYFHRNNAFDARNWFNKEPDPQKALRLHQFGFTAGGPIIGAKLSSSDHMKVHVVSSATRKLETHPPRSRPFTLQAPP